MREKKKKRTHINKLTNSQVCTKSNILAFALRANAWDIMTQHRDVALCVAQIHLSLVWSLPAFRLDATVAVTSSIDGQFWTLGIYNMIYRGPSHRSSSRLRMRANLLAM